MSGAILSPAGAQNSAEADYAAYIDRIEALGFETSNGGVRYEASADRLVIADDRLVLSGTFPLPEGEESNQATPEDELTYELVFTAGTTIIEGFDEENGTFSARNWSYSDDARLVIRAESAGQGRGQFEFRFIDTEITDYSFEVPALPAADPERPASRWLAFARAVLGSSYETTTIGAMALTMEAYETSPDGEQLVFSATGQMNGYRALNAAAGRVAEYGIDSIVQNTLTRNEATGEMLSQTTRYGETVYKDIDAMAIVDLFDPAIPETGERVTITGSQIARGYESRQDLGGGVALEIRGGESRVENIYVIKRDFDFLGLLDQLLRGEEPRVEDAIRGALQLYRSFGVDVALINDIAVSVPDIGGPDSGFSFEISEMGMTDIGPDGIGSLDIAGVNAPALPEGGSFSLNLASIGDIEFADYGPMSDMIDQLVNDPSFADKNPLAVARAFAPRSFGITVEGLDINLPGTDPIALDLYVLDLWTTVPPIPTAIELRTDNFTLPVSVIEDADARQVLEGLGLDTLTWSDETRIYWDEASQDLTLERIYVSVAGIGTLEGSLRFANVPRAALEDPQGQGQIALAMASFVDGEFRFVDDGLIESGLAFAAKDAGVPESVMTAAFIEQAVEATAFFQNEAFTEMTRDAATRFLKETGTLNISVKPANSIPLTQILGNLAAPQTLPDLLNLQISAE
ncbi:hypothetical protein GCM10011316_18180 [Roseibium aquae]|uniref:Uncharacterized protein n=1 Tax=Roseibium aquae TaxID=1323746 RepID=A0A916WZT5_9HYPH|nr:hypothetical protein [Roseibium aquae]GGB46425.1 hypothetical protein GCM10011316_18180 [Roseibium aquae]